MKILNRNNTLLLVALCSTPILLSCQDLEVVPTGAIDGHEYVDLGLSVKWATCNVGAESPKEYGDYFAWGETETKSNYSEENSKTYQKDIDDIGCTNYDVAHVKWGGAWRLPTASEFGELIDNCDYEWTTLHGVEGGKFTSRKNGNFIFLPAAGQMSGTLPFRAISKFLLRSYDSRSYDPSGIGSRGFYWSSSPDKIFNGSACILYFSSGDHSCITKGRNIGCSVRPVLSATEDDTWDIESLRKAAEEGDAYAQFNLGSCYYNGLGVTEDNEMGVKWIRKAAEQGNADAQLALGWSYFMGVGVTQDYNKGVEWMRKAAEQGRADAQVILGSCYYDGIGVTQDYNKAVEWYRKAAEQGDADAQCYLGTCYGLGQGVARDNAKAVEWLHKSAEQGNPEAQCYLALHYKQGKGVEQDKEKAAEWCQKAADQGYKPAIELLKELRSSR